MSSLSVLTVTFDKLMFFVSCSSQINKVRAQWNCMSSLSHFKHRKRGQKMIVAALKNVYHEELIYCQEICKYM